MKRLQPLVVVRRKVDGLYWCQSTKARDPQWTDDIRLANVINPFKVLSMIRIDWGRDADSFEVVPITISEEVTQ